MKKVAVILSGAGYLDGAEISESVITLLEIDKNGAEYQCFAPDIDQMHVVDHLSGDEIKGASRNVLKESARIARGKIKPLSDLKGSDFDCLIMPGGFGVAKNLSDIAVKGSNGVAIEELKKIVLSFFDSKKPIGAICISPAIIASIINGRVSAKLTLGKDEDNLISNLGSTHIDCSTSELCSDDENKIYSCSAYMQEASISDVAEGIAKVVSKVLQTTP